MINTRCTIMSLSTFLVHIWSLKKAKLISSRNPSIFAMLSSRSVDVVFSIAVKDWSECLLDNLDNKISRPTLLQLRRSQSP